MPTTRAFSLSVTQIKEKVKSSYASAKGRNSIEQATWGSAPDWQASTTYKAGSVVKAGGYLYLMFGNSTTGVSQSGTSGGSTPFNADPYGSSQYRGLISDNTCRWLFYGQVNSLSSRPLVSTVTPAAATDVMDGYVAQIANSALSTLGLTREYAASSVQTANGQSFWYTGGPFNFSTFPTILGPNAGTQASPSYPDSQKRPVVDLETNARWIAFKPSGPIYNTFNYLIEVNDRLLTPGPWMPSTTASNNSFLIDLSTIPAPRRVRIYGYQDLRTNVLSSVFVGPLDNVNAPENPSRFSLALEGDSITQGGNSSPVFNGLDLAAQTARLLGCDSFYNNAQGGTGFIADNSNTKTTYAQRLERLVLFNPDILIVGGNHNDASPITSPQRQQAVIDYLTTARTALPRTTIMVTGGHLLTGDSATGAVLTQEGDISAAVATYLSTTTDSNVRFVPVLSDTGGAWVTGTGTGNSPQSNGTKDRFYWTLASVFTDSHPLPAFYEYTARRYANAVLEWANG